MEGVGGGVTLALRDEGDASGERAVREKHSSFASVLTIPYPSLSSTMSNGRRSPWPTILSWVAIATIVIIAIVVLVSIFSRPFGWFDWLLMKVDTQDARHLYLLSATAQVLAALFALVFSITLIAVQFVTKYTHRTMRMVFNARILTYIGGFALAVILPLWFISHPSGFGSLLSLIVGSVYVLSLIGFFYYLRKKLSIDTIIEDLKTEALEYLNKKEITKAEGNINALDGIIMGAFTDRNFEVFKLAIKESAELAFAIERSIGELKEKTNEKKLHDLLMENLFDTALEVINNRRAPRIIAEMLGQVGSEAIKEKRERTWSVLSLTIDVIDKWCTTKENAIASLECAKALHKMAMSAPQDIIDGKQELIFGEGGPYTLMIKCLDRIYRKHASKDEWAEFYKKDIDNLVVLIPTQISTFVSGIRAFHLLDTMFEFLDSYTKRDDIRGARDFEDTLSKLFESLKKEIVKKGFENSVGFLMSLGKILDKKNKEILEKEKDNRNSPWLALVEEFYDLISKIADFAIENSNYFLCWKAHTYYLSAFNESALSVSSLLIMLTSQTSSILKTKPNEFNEEWATAITYAFKVGMKGVIESRLVSPLTPINSKTIWMETKPVAEDFLDIATHNNWEQAKNNLQEFFKLEELFKNNPPLEFPL